MTRQAHDKTKAREAVIGAALGRLHLAAKAGLLAVRANGHCRKYPRYTTVPVDKNTSVEWWTALNTPSEHQPRAALAAPPGRLKPYSASSPRNAYPDYDTPARRSPGPCT